MKAKSKILDYYLPKLKENKSDASCLGWENEQAQNLRFRVLEKVLFQNVSLLDVGCGLGNLYEYLAKGGYKINYTGIDILEEMIKRAKEKNVQLEFLSGNIFDKNCLLLENRKFDVVFASGIFNIDLGNNEEFFCLALEKLLKLSSKFVVFNNLHKRSKNMEKGYFYTTPEAVEKVLPKVKNVTFIDDYLDNDFSTILEVL